LNRYWNLYVYKFTAPVSWLKFISFRTRKKGVSYIIALLITAAVSSPKHSPIIHTV